MRILLYLALLLPSACARLPYVAAPRALDLRGTLVVFQDSTGPLSYQSPAGIDPAKTWQTVTAERCQSGLRLPIPTLVQFGSNGGNQIDAIVAVSAAWGHGGYSAAMADLEAQAEGKTLHDIRADLKTISILGVWIEQCIVLHAARAT